MVSINKEEITQKPQNNDSEVVLSVNGVSKRFCRDLKKSLFYGVQDIASELVGLRGSSNKLRTKEFWALNDVSFKLRRGEALGLVGKNGSGKSTLLRIIAGLIKPDAGTVEVNGRIAPLIALGAGFNPILTGRENIYANMSILGLSKKEIDERFDEVLEFAEIGDAIDAPVRSYSSGMAARLGFASAIHTEPDILLIDEVLAVGDIRFKQKCHTRLVELRKKGTTFILVTHQTQSILSICEKSLYLSKGKMINYGDSFQIIDQYEKDLFPNTFSKGQAFRDDNNQLIEPPVTGSKTTFVIGCEAYTSIKDINIFLDITSIHVEGKILHTSNFNDQTKLDLEAGHSELQLKMNCFGLLPGCYSMKVLVRQGSFDTIDYVESFKFEVAGKTIASGSLYYQDRIWKVETGEKYEF